MIGHHMTIKGTIIDQAKLMRFYNYNPYHGRFYLLRTGEEVIVKEYKNGYKYGEFFGDMFRVDKLVVLWLTGVYPKKVKHRDRDLANNHWSNLIYPLREDKKWLKAMNKSGFRVHIANLCEVVND
jgi:hypothetical protein